MLRIIRKTVGHIRHLAYWLPVIWNDQDWDYGFIYTMLRHKLAAMEKELREHGTHVDSQQDADNIHYAVMLLDRIINQVYYDRAYRPHELKWGKGEFVEEPYENNPEYRSIDVRYPKAKTPEEQKQARKEAIRCVAHLHYLEQQDLDALFTHLRKHIEGWWD